jgi:hypothetical protein
MIIDLGRLSTVAVLAGLGVLGWNMLRDDAGLAERAAELSCRGRACTAEFQKKTRNLFGWTFTFATYGDRSLLVDVTCTRQLWVLGDYACDVSEADHAADFRFKQR